MVSNRSVVNLLVSMSGRPGCVESDRLLAVTTLSFDIAALELYLPLITGARVILASREAAMSGQQLHKLIQESGATIMQGTPRTWQLLIEAGWEGTPGLKMLCGGEAIPADLANRLVARGEIWNMYGPTETTIWSATAPIKQSTRLIPIGFPIANTKVYILDRNQQIVPVGVVGELYIGGDGVARGYLNREDLTAERFVKDVFSSDEQKRMYKTGDLCRWLPVGNIEFLGRNDDQVKLRGFRIELGEIETRLLEHPLVHQAVVVAREDKLGEKRLVAYYRNPNPEEQVGAEALRTHLANSLPDYMVPTAYVRLEAFPLTANGKVARNGLPAPEIDAFATTKFEEPEGETEAVLAQIWSDLLKIDPVGRYDSFFDLGGHSLLATKLVLRVERVMGVEITLRDVFLHPQLFSLAEILLNAQLEQFDPADLASAVKTMQNSGFQGL
jgi:non-ribosomal peptide synthetase component F